MANIMSKSPPVLRQDQAKAAIPVAVAAIKAHATPTIERIRARAHEIFLARKSGAGDPVSDWLQAEKELCGLVTPVPGAARPAETTGGAGAMRSDSSSRSEALPRAQRG